MVLEVMKSTWFLQQLPPCTGCTSVGKQPCISVIAQTHRNKEAKRVLYTTTYRIIPYSSMEFVNKFPAPYWTRRFITVITGARHWNLSRATWIQPTSWHCTFNTHFNIILPPPFRSPTRPLPFSCVWISHGFYIPCPVHTPWFNHFNIWSCRLRISSLRNFLGPPSTSFPLVSNTYSP
jgi:hypothetical protein